MKKQFLTATLLFSLLTPNTDVISQEPNKKSKIPIIAGGTIATGALASTIYFLYKANSYKKRLLKRPSLTIEEETKFEKKLKLYKMLAIASEVIAAEGLALGSYGSWHGNHDGTTQLTNNPEEPEEDEPYKELTRKEAFKPEEHLEDAECLDEQNPIQSQNNSTTTPNLQKRNG